MPKGKHSNWAIEWIVKWGELSNDCEHRTIDGCEEQWNNCFHCLDIELVCKKKIDEL